MSTSQPMSVRRVCVIGGNGFVGSAVCKEGIKRGLVVTSINRSGPPSSEPWISKVKWVKGDVLDEQGEWKQSLADQDAVISCVGGFGSVDWMRKINGTATINAARAANQVGVPRFGFVSAHHFALPQFMMKGYFEGKLAAEEEIKNLYGSGSSSQSVRKLGAIANPGTIYGPRLVHSANITIPLQFIFAPIAFVTNFTTPLLNLPFVGTILTPVLLPPVKVEQVAATLLDAVCDPSAAGVRSYSVFDIQQHQSHT